VGVFSEHIGNGSMKIQ